MFRFQDRGRGFQDQVGKIAWNIYGTMKYTDGVFGGRCMDSTGQSIYYDNSSDEELSNILKQPFTVFMWVYPKGSGGTEDHLFYIKGNDRPDIAFIINDHQMRNDYSGWREGDYNYNFANKWTHVAYVYEGQESLKGRVYVNGEKVRTTNFNNYLTPRISIGLPYFSPDWYTYYYRGYVDDICLIKGDLIDGDTYTVPSKYL